MASTFDSTWGQSALNKIDALRQQRSQETCRNVSREDALRYLQNQSPTDQRTLLGNASSGVAVNRLNRHSDVS